MGKAIGTSGEGVSQPERTPVIHWQSQDDIRQEGDERGKILLTFRAKVIYDKSMVGINPAPKCLEKAIALHGATGPTRSAPVESIWTSGTEWRSGKPRKSPLTGGVPPSITRGSQ